jgi:hypothetical protein
VVWAFVGIDVSEVAVSWCVARGVSVNVCL